MMEFSLEEQEYYSDLFTRYDVEKTGKLTTDQAMVLFLSSHVSTDKLLKISDLCGAERVGQYGRSQFFIALKLIALVQSGQPVPKTLDSIASGLEIPLPQFGENVEEMGTEFENPGFMGSNKEAEINRVNGGGFPPPPQPTRAGITSNIILQSIDEHDGTSPQDVSPASSSPPASPVQYHRDPPSPISPAPPSDEPLSPAPSSGLGRQQSLPAASTPMGKEGTPKPRKQISLRQRPTDGGWAEFEMSRTQGTPNTSEADGSWATFPPPPAEEEQNHTVVETVEAEEGEETKEEKSGAPEEETDDPWVITKEQKKYYTTQFQNIQQDVTQAIKGPAAKAFFEKSKLPLYELSQIWQLSDVNKDGTLYLEEFCTAMHLVVLRKHQIDLPEELPKSLIPKIGRSITPPSSAGSEAKQDEDAKIFQPIPVHLAPDGKPLPEEGGEQTRERPRTFSDPLKLERHEEPGSPKSPAKIRSLTHADTIDSTPTKIAPPPSTGKRRGFQLDGQGAEPARLNPPLIPPRPGAQDVNVQYVNTPKRAMSVGEKSLQKTENRPEYQSDEDIEENSEKEGPPQLPPRPNLPEEFLNGVFPTKKSSERHHSVDLDYDDDEKEAEESIQDRRRHKSAPHTSSSKKRSKPKDRLAIQAAIRAAKEANSRLSRLNGELHQELGQVTEDRVALETQLQKLKPFRKFSDS